MAYDLHKPKDRAKYRKALFKRRDNFFDPSSRIMANAFDAIGKQVVAAIKSEDKINADKISKIISDDGKPIIKEAFKKIWVAVGSDGYSFASEMFGGTLYGTAPKEAAPFEQKLFGLHVPAWLTHVANYMMTGKVGDRRIDGVTDETEQEVQNSIFAGMEQEEGVPQIAERVQSHFDGMSQGRARVIAQSETVDAYNQAILQEGKDAGSRLWLMWIITDDLKVRPAHLAMDGKVVPPDEQFECDDGTVMPGEAVNCRCCLGKAVPTDEQRAEFE